MICAILEIKISVAISVRTSSLLQLIQWNGNELKNVQTRNTRCNTWLYKNGKCILKDCTSRVDCTLVFQDALQCAVFKNAVSGMACQPLSHTGRPATQVIWSLDQVDIDFFVVGFAKAGSTAFDSVLNGISRDVGTYPSEWPGLIHAAKGSKQKFHEELLKLYSFYIHELALRGSKVRGLRNPAHAWNREAMAQLAAARPATKIIVLLRDPITWFQSFINYRVIEMYESGFLKNATSSGRGPVQFRHIPDLGPILREPIRELKSVLDARCWRYVCKEAGAFHPCCDLGEHLALLSPGAGVHHCSRGEK